MIIALKRDRAFRRRSRRRGSGRTVKATRPKPLQFSRREVYERIHAALALVEAPAAAGEEASHECTP